MNRIQQQAITEFARDTLGCQCPDEVFNSIALVRVNPTDGSPAYDRIVIGKRLLIHVVQANPGTTPIDQVLALAESGIRVRNQHGYNRFRLVLVSSTRLDEELAQTRFLAATHQDTKAHLHVVEQKDFSAWILRDQDPKSGFSWAKGPMFSMPRF